MENINLQKCTLDPQGNPNLKRRMRVEILCDNCAKCGWNADVIATRKAEQEKRNRE